MPGPRVALAIPAFNEADGLGGFLEEIDRAVTPAASDLHIVVVDDASSDGTADAARACAARMSASLEVVTNSHNRGHGPSLITAYRRALAAAPDFVLQVDGDGQFHGSDLRRVLVLLIDEAHAVCGVRRFRQDSWFRMRMTALLRMYLTSGFSVRARDANCPLRGYDAKLLNHLLESVPEDCLIPNLYLTILAARQEIPLLEVDVSHRVRRGAHAQGTTWGRGISPVPWRLLRFSALALRESVEFRRQLQASPAPGSPVAGGKLSDSTRDH
jgi:dolichol-phosphate mannosyltransferase